MNKKILFIGILVVAVILLGGCLKLETTTECGNSVCESGENGNNCPEDCCASGDGVCPAGCTPENDGDCDCYLNLAETLEDYALKKEDFWYGVLATDNYNVLGEELRREDEIIQLIKKAQNADGTWNERPDKLHYAPNTARTLMALSRLNVDFSTIKPLEPFLETVDTWDEVKEDVREYGVPNNFWGEVWGYITLWNVYKNEQPPYIKEFYQEVIDYQFEPYEDGTSAWAYDSHQRNHLIDMLRQLCIPVPRRDEVIQIILQQQGGDGSWENSNCGETAQTILILNYLNASADEAKQKAIDFIWNKCYVEMNIDDKKICGFKGFPDEERVSSNPNPTVIAILIQEGYLTGDPSVFMTRQFCE